MEKEDSQREINGEGGRESLQSVSTYAAQIGGEAEFSTGQKNDKERKGYMYICTIGGQRCPQSCIILLLRKGGN